MVKSESLNRRTGSKQSAKRIRKLQMAQKRKKSREIRTYLFVILTSVLVLRLQETSQAQDAAAYPRLLLDSTTAIDIGPLIGQLTPQPLNPGSGTTQGPILPTGTDLNNQLNPAPIPANELLPNSQKNVVETVSQKLWRLTFTFGTGVFYDDNLFITRFNRQSDTVFTLDAGAAFELGDYRSQIDNFLIAKYLVTGYLFTDHTTEDSADQDVVINGRYRFSNFTFDSNILYDYLNGPDRLVGTFINRQLIDGRFRLTYDLSPKTQLYGEFEQITNIYESFLNSFEYIGRVGVDYQITGKIKLGIQGVVGSLQQEGSFSSIYGQGRLHISYQYTEKLNFDATVGGEYRQYSGGSKSEGDPVFTLGLTYRPFVDTTFSLNAFRSEFASPLFTAQDFVGTGVSFTLTQKFIDRFTASLAFGYEHDDYTPTNSSVANINRDDDYVFVRPGLTYSFKNWLTVTIYYQYSRNSSSQSLSGYYDNRVGGQISIFF
jgi:hypothetical protein